MMESITKVLELIPKIPPYLQVIWIIWLSIGMILFLISINKVNKRNSENENSTKKQSETKNNTQTVRPNIIFLSPKENDYIEDYIEDDFIKVRVEIKNISSAEIKEKNLKMTATINADNETFSDQVLINENNLNSLRLKIKINDKLGGDKAVLKVILKDEKKEISSNSITLRLTKGEKK